MIGAYESPHPQKLVDLENARIAYVDTGRGEGAPIVFLHGNPTSSYLWRNIIPHVADRYRCLAPDLAGMGNSGPMAGGRYRFFDHYRVIAEWLDTVQPNERCLLVCHDWGSALAFHWACRHEERVAGIVYMEAIVAPREWSDFPEGRDKLFRRLRGSEGEHLVLQENYFVERVLPASIMRNLTDAEMDVYRAPFGAPEMRLPTLQWPRDLPIGGEPDDIVKTVETFRDWLMGCAVPKLFVNAEPGAILVGRARQTCRGFKNQREVTVPGIHFVQEDSAEAIGRALSAFADDVFNKDAAGLGP